jgi:hypothetical protein
MPSSEMWSLVGLIIIDVSENSIASIFRMERIKELGKRLEVISN